MDQVEPLTKSSFAEQIARTLRRQILSGSLRPGDRLPPERELARRFGTNRNTLREAIRTLEGLRLVSVKQGHGVRVRDYRCEAEATILPYFIAEGPSLEERSVVLGDILGLRRLVLAEAASLAAMRADDGDLRDLEAQIERIEEILPDGDSLVELDLAFYHLLLKASHSLASVWMFNTFLSAYRRALPLVKGMWVTPPDYVASLRKLVAAIRKRDEKKAARILRSHLGRGDEIVLTKIANA